MFSEEPGRCTLAGMANQQRSTRRSTRQPVENGQPSDEYKRFEGLMRRLVRVPKKEIDARREAERKGA